MDHRQYLFLTLGNESTYTPTYRPLCGTHRPDKIVLLTKIQQNLPRLNGRLSDCLPSQATTNMGLLPRSILLSENYREQPSSYTTHQSGLPANVCHGFTPGWIAGSSSRQGESMDPIIYLLLSTPYKFTLAKIEDSLFIPFYGYFSFICTQLYITIVSKLGCDQTRQVFTTTLYVTTLWRQ